MQGHLRSLKPHEEFALFLATRGHHGLDVDQPGFAARCYQNAAGYDPTRPAYRGWLAQARKRLTPSEGLALGGDPKDKERRAAEDKIIANQGRLVHEPVFTSGFGVPPQMPSPINPGHMSLPSPRIIESTTSTARFIR